MKNTALNIRTSEQSTVLLDDKEWKTFCNQLNKKPKFKKALHDLIVKPNVSND